MWYNAYRKHSVTFILWKGSLQMDFKAGVGKSDFAALRESGNYYVDKTELIYELVNGYCLVSLT